MRMKKLVSQLQYDDDCIAACASLPNVLQGRYQFNSDEKDFVAEVKKKYKVPPRFL